MHPHRRMQTHLCARAGLIVTKESRGFPRWGLGRDPLHTKSRCTHGIPHRK